MAVVVEEAAARAAAALQAGAAAQAVPGVCGKPANQARRLAAVAAELVRVALAAEVEMAAAAQAVAVDRVVVDRAVVGRVVEEEASAARAEEQVAAGLVVVALEGEPAVEQAVGAALSASPGDG